MEIGWTGKWTALALCCVLLSACAPGTRTVTLDVTKVTLPASVSATAEMGIDLTASFGGCTTFQGIVAERTASTLKLTVQGSEPGGNPICPAYIGYFDRTYTDPGSPPRTDPFEVYVNGKSYGTVAVR